MTRREQIEKAAYTALERDLEVNELESFILGAKWSDINPPENWIAYSEKYKNIQEKLSIAVEYLEYISIQSCCKTCVVCLSCEAESALRKVVPNDPLGIKGEYK